MISAVPSISCAREGGDPGRVRRVTRSCSIIRCSAYLDRGTGSENRGYHTSSPSPPLLLHIPPPATLHGPSHSGRTKKRKGSRKADGGIGRCLGSQPRLFENLCKSMPDGGVGWVAAAAGRYNTLHFHKNKPLSLFLKTYRTRHSGLNTPNISCQPTRPANSCVFSPPPPFRKKKSLVSGRCAIIASPSSKPKAPITTRRFPRHKQHRNRDLYPLTEIQPRFSNPPPPLSTPSPPSVSLYFMGNGAVFEICFHSHVFRETDRIASFLSFFSCPEWTP